MTFDLTIIGLSSYRDAIPGVISTFFWTWKRFGSKWFEKSLGDLFIITCAS